MSIVEKYRPYYTYADYLLWEGKWELIGGLPYAMSPAPNMRHQWIANVLGSKFFTALKGCKKCKVYQPIDWKVADDTVLQPDLSIVCKPFSNNNYLDFSPVLVVEIISPSSALKDRREKFEIYQQQKVKYYLLIEPGFNKVEVFELTENVYKPVAVNPPSFDFLIEDCTASISFVDLFEE